MFRERVGNINKVLRTLCPNLKVNPGKSLTKQFPKQQSFINLRIQNFLYRQVLMDENCHASIYFKGQRC